MFEHVTSRRGRFACALIVLIALTTPGSLASFVGDGDGSLDVDLALGLGAPASTPAGSDFTVALELSNATTSDGAAFDVGVVLVLPPGVSFVSSTLGERILHSTDSESGETTVAIEGTLALSPGDSVTKHVTLRPASDLPAGTLLPLYAVAYADDSPFERGEAPPDQPDARFGGVDLSYPTDLQAQEADPMLDDVRIDFPSLPLGVSEEHFTHATVALSLFDLRVIASVSEGERATGTGRSAYSTRIRLIGNGVDDVTHVFLRDALSANRTFLGFESVPAGAKAVALANQPEPGQVLLEISSITIPAGGSVDVVYRSGITEYDVIDATNPYTEPADDDGVKLGERVVEDGGAEPGGGERATDRAEVVLARFQGESVDPALFPAPASASVEAEYLAIRKASANATREIGDRNSYTLTFSVSEYLDIVAPFTIEDVLPDGLVFDGPEAVVIDAIEGAKLVFDPESGIADPATGDTVIRFVLAEGSRIPAGSTATITYSATVDGRFEGEGEQDFEVGETLTNRVTIQGVVADDGSTDPSIVKTTTADDSSATIGTPKPTLSTAVVSITTSGGTVYDGTLETPNFDLTRDVVRPGSMLRFAVTVDFPGVPTLDVLLDDFLPLLTGPNTAIEKVLLNTEVDLVDLSGSLIAFNDGDADGTPDAIFGERTAPWFPADGFPVVAINNGLRFELGDVREHARLVLLVDARVTSDVPQPIPTDGLVLTRNVATMSYGSDTGARLDTLTGENEFSIGLPYVTIAKTRIDTGGEDAGNLMRFQVKLVNEGHSVAFLDDVLDTLPSDVVLLPATLTVTDGALRPQEHSAEYDESTNTLRVSFRQGAGEHRNELPHAAHDATTDDHIVLITYEVRIVDGVLPGTKLTNTATTNYFSAADAPVHEAFGPISASASLTLTTVSLTKTVTATSAPHTTSTNVTIGETITYRVEARIPEGVVVNAQLQDRLPSGLEMISVRLLSIDASMTTNGGTNAPAITYGDFRDKDGVLDGCDIDLGTITSTASASSATRTIAFEVVARVMNVASNKNNTNRSNSVTFYSGATRLASGSRSVKVVLPMPQVTKTADETLVDAGDEFNYTVRTSHASSSTIDGYDARITDVLPTGITLVSLGAVRATGGATGVSALSGSGTAADPLLVTVESMPRGAAVEFDVRVKITGSFEPLQKVRNTASSSLRTLPGQDPLAGSSSANGTHDLTMANIGIDKEFVTTSLGETGEDAATIGERVTYRIEVRIPEGTARNVVVKDTLTPGLAFAEPVAIDLDAALSATTPQPVPSTATPGVVSWNFGTITNSDRNDAHDEVIAITYTAVVTNVASNVIGGSVVNSALAQHALGSSETASVATPLVAPELQVRAVFDEKYGRAGDRVHLVYEVWHASGSPFTAYDADVVTTIPDTLRLVGNLVSLSGPEAVLDDSRAPREVRVALGDLGLEYDRSNTVSFSLEFELTEAFRGDLAEFPVNARWSTLHGEPGVLVAGVATAVERTGDTANAGGNANDLRTRYDAIFDDYSTFRLGFEDLGLVKEFNDFDYNDVLLEVDSDESYDEFGRLTHLKARVEVLARGAAFDHRLELRLGVAGPANVVMTRYDATGRVRTIDRWFSDDGFVSDAIMLYSTTQSLPAWNRGASAFASNTARDQAKSEIIPGFVTEIEVEVLDPDRNPEVRDIADTPHINEHIAALYGFNLFVWSLSENVSAAGAGRHSAWSLVTDANFPGSPLDGYPLDQTMLFPRTAKWPVERVPIWKAFPDFVRFTMTGGTLNRAWFTAAEAAETWPAGETVGVNDSRPLESPDAPTLEAPVLGGMTAGTVARSTSSKFGPAGPGKGGFASIDAGRTWTGGAQTPWLGEIRAQLAHRVVASGPMPSGALAFDTDDDGTVEVVFANYLGDVFVADALTGETRTHFTLGGGSRSQAPLAIGDIDGDGTVEVLRGHENGRVVRAALDGSDLAEIASIGAPVKSGMALGDIDLDGTDDVVFMGGDGKLHVLSQGAPAAGFPLALSSQRDVGSHFFFTSTPVIADLDGDGSPEIVTGTLDGTVHAIRRDGTTVDGWPYTMTAPVLATPAVGAIDGSGAIVIAIADNNGVLALLDASGSPRPGWPIQPAGSGGTASPVIADLDGDHRAEILIGGSSGLVHALDVFAQPKPGWPLQLGGSVMGSLTVTNADADAELEVAVGSSDGRLTIIDTRGRQGWLDANGRAWALRTNGMIAATPLAADVDGDGSMDLAVPSYDGSCYVISTEGTDAP